MGSGFAFSVECDASFSGVAARGDCRAARGRVPEGRLPGDAVTVGSESADAPDSGFFADAFWEGLFSVGSASVGLATTFRSGALALAGSAVLMGAGSTDSRTASASCAAL